MLVVAPATALLVSLGCATAPPTMPAAMPTLASPTNECAWVTSYGGDDVCGVEIPSGKSLGCVRTGARPHGVAVSRDGTRVYVSNEGANSLSVIGTTDRRVVAEVPVGQTPNQLALTPDDSHVWILNNAAASISVVSTASNAVERTIPSGRGPHIIAVNAARNAAIVTSEGDSSLEVFDLTSYERVAHVPVYAWPRVLAVTSDGMTAYLTIRWLNGALAVGLGGDGPRGRVALGEPRFAPEGKDAHGIALTPDGSELLITTQMTGQLTFVAPGTLDARGQVAVGHNPNWIDLTSDGRFAVASNTDDDTISIVDVPSRRVVSTVPVGRQPKRLAVGRCPAGRSQ